MYVYEYNIRKESILRGKDVGWSIKIRCKTKKGPASKLEGTTLKGAMGGK